MTQLFIGIIAEGTTDYRFLEPIVEKTLTEIVFDCKGQIDIDIKAINCDKGRSFSEYVSNGSHKGSQEYGINLLIIHSDADDQNAVNTYKNKIHPALSYIDAQPDGEYCKNIAPLIPIFETESWMLADKEIFIDIICTNKTEVELNINGNPESFTNPKVKIEEAIRIGRALFQKKRRESLRISDLYSYLGQKISVEKLRNLSSFIDFEKNVRTALIKQNLLQDLNKNEK